MKKHNYQIKLSQNTVLRKRSTKREACINNIVDYDLYLQDAISNEIGCIPPFWAYRMKGRPYLEECTSPEKLKKVNNMTADIYKNKLGKFQSPCVDMFNAIVWHQPKCNYAAERCGDIEILYMEKYYEEITQVDDFNFQDFVSNLGGFIGIFLGYSMMQIPELLGKIEIPRS